MSTAPSLAPTDDKHGRVADGVPCAFLCRGSRPCTRRARDPTTAFCSAHQPDVLEAARALARLHFANGPPAKGQFRASDAPRKRISSSQKRMMNPFSSGHRSQRAGDGANGGEAAAAATATATLAALAPNSLAAVFADPTRPLHVDIGCARGLCVQQCAIAAPPLNYLGVELRPELVTIANQWCDAHFGTQHGGGGSVGHSGALSDVRPRRNLHFVAGNINACIDSLAAALPVDARWVETKRRTRGEAFKSPG